MRLDIKPPASSLYLQVFITFETYYSVFYLVFLFAIEFYKGKHLSHLSFSNKCRCLCARLRRADVPAKRLGHRTGVNLHLLCAADHEAGLGPPGE